MDLVKPVIELIVEYWDTLVNKTERGIAPWFWRPIIGPGGRKIGDLIALMVFVLAFSSATLATIAVLMLSRDLLGNHLGSLLGVLGGACGTWFMFGRCLRQRLVAPPVVKIGKASAYLVGVLLDRVVAPKLPSVAGYFVVACLVALAFLPAKANK